jgi:hypothetical protein
MLNFMLLTLELLLSTASSIDIALAVFPAYLALISTTSWNNTNTPRSRKRGKRLGYLLSILAFSIQKYTSCFTMKHSQRVTLRLLKLSLTLRAP